MGRGADEIPKGPVKNAKRSNKAEKERFEKLYPFAEYENTQEFLRRQEKGDLFNEDSKDFQDMKTEIRFRMGDSRDSQPEKSGEYLPSSVHYKTVERLVFTAIRGDEKYSGNQSYYDGVRSINPGEGLASFLEVKNAFNIRETNGLMIAEIPRYQLGFTEDDLEKETPLHIMKKVFRALEEKGKEAVVSKAKDEEFVKLHGSPPQAAELLSVYGTFEKDEKGNVIKRELHFVLEPFVPTEKLASQYKWVRNSHGNFAGYNKKEWAEYKKREKSAKTEEEKKKIAKPKAIFEWQTGTKGQIRYNPGDPRKRKGVVRYSIDVPRYALAPEEMKDLMDKAQRDAADKAMEKEQQ
jgi:hypothetical protein